jgi:hypothetical protein
VAKVKFLLLCYDKYIVENIYLFQDEESLKKHLINMLLRDCSPRNIEIDDNNTMKEVMHIINKEYNYDDGDFCNLVYKVNGKTASLIYKDL